MSKNLTRILSGLLLVVFAACEQPPTVKPEYPNIVQSNGALYILNEGNFQSSNASIDYISFSDQSVHNNAFETKNGRPLGDVLQSVSRWGTKGYLVVNNSAKIEVVNFKDLSSIATITGFKSPRYMCIQNENKAYVSEYYGGGVKIVDLTNNTISATIDVAGNCEEMVLLNNKLYVTSTNKRYVYVVNTISDLVMDSIAVAYAPNSLRLDKNNMLWVLCAGNPAQGKFENGALCQINPQTDSLVKQFTITPQSEHGSIKLRSNAAGTVFYWINRDVYSHAIDATSIKQLPFVVSTGGSFWALNYDSLANEVFVGNALDFNQRSVISRYDLDGNMKGTFKGGIITTDFYFWY